MTFRTSSVADADIAEVYAAGSLRFGKAQAERDQDGLFDVFRLLAANPRMARERRTFEPLRRLRPYEAHMIAYVELETGILIIRVLHGRQVGDCESMRRSATSGARHPEDALQERISP